LKVPEVDVIAAGDLEKASGAMNQATWTLKINAKTLQKATLTEAEFADLVNTVYHEGRHAEQFYQIARYLHAQGLDPQFIRDIADLPLDVAIAARNDTSPMTAQQMADAKRYMDSLVGGESGARYSGYKVRRDQANTIKAAESALEALERDPNATALQIAQAKQTLAQERAAYSVLHQDYLALPEEVDAWATGNRVERDLVQTRTLLGRIEAKLDAFLTRAVDWIQIVLRIKQQPELAQTHLALDQQVAAAHAWITDTLAALKARRNALTGADAAEAYEIQWLDYQIQRVTEVKLKYDQAMAVQP
jgi:hypothetical protein